MNTLARLYEKLSSIRLTIFLCIVLALVCLLGTLVPQNQTPADYQRAYGAGGAELLRLAGITDLYHSAGFSLLLGLLAANLLACTSKRLPPTWRAFRSGHPARESAQLKGWKHRETFVLRSNPPEAERGALEEALCRALGKGVRQRQLEGDGKLFVLEKRRYARLGPWLAHAGILAILVGGFLGARFGFRGSLVVPEGGEGSQVWVREGESIPLGFRIRCDRFNVESYPNGTPREYRSDVTVLDDPSGKAVSKASIRVNHPFTYRGITFYQSSFGTIPKMTFRVENRRTGEAAVVEADLEKPFQLPGDPSYRAVAVSFQEELVVPARMAQAASLPGTQLGPAARLVLFGEQGSEGEFWVLKDFPELNHQANGLFHVTMTKYSSTPYTGLQVARDPGTPLVWAGCIVLVIGFVLSLLLDHEVFLVASERRGDGRLVVRAAGKAVRHPGAYQERFEKRRDKIRAALAPWLEGKTHD
ncbi:MAG: cytochrome c biogenesis protein ResB [bacterium]